MSRRAELDLATEAAREAGRRLRELAREESLVLSAEGRDIKTVADQEAEAIVLERLRAGSDYPLLAEESGEHGAPADGPFWVIDPLDGTMNYTRGLPLCCVSIALMQSDRPLLGVVFDFNSGDLYRGVPGQGAWLNDRPLHASDREDSRQATLATGFPTQREFTDAALREMFDTIRRFKKTRMFGTAALSLAWVAAGRVDAYAEDDIMLWDVAAGLALVEAAGGYVALEPSPRLKWARHVRCAGRAAIWSP